MPPVAAPVLNDIEPLDPELEVPDANVNAPLTPDTPAFDVRNEMAPLVELAPRPLTIEIDPPVAP